MALAAILRHDGIEHGVWWGIVVLILIAMVFTIAAIKEKDKDE